MVQILVVVQSSQANSKGKHLIVPIRHIFPNCPLLTVIPYSTPAHAHVLPPPSSSKACWWKQTRAKSTIVSPLYAPCTILLCYLWSLYYHLYYLSHLLNWLLHLLLWIFLHLYIICF